MKYELLKSKFYLYSSKPKAYADEVKRRQQAFGSVRFPLIIKDYSAQEEHEAFLACNYEQSVLIEKICLCAARINSIFSRFPEGAKNHYINQCLIDEIQNTNEIENIHSTRQEINHTIDAIRTNRKAGRKRFEGMIKKYLMLLNDEIKISLNSSMDVRKLYDDVVLDEINAEDIPDGTIFRKGTVYIDNPHGDHIHQGVGPEEKLIEYIEQSIKILNSEDLPVLIRIAVFHYLFSYAHPFYDGNGRINRFVMSELLYQNVNRILGLAASAEFKMKKAEYYKAFSICNEGKNAGDITPFVIAFLEILFSAAQRVEGQVREGNDKLIYYERTLDSLKPLLFGVKEKDIETKKGLLFVFIQAALFSDEDNYFNISELKTYSEVGLAKTRRLVHEMITIDQLPIMKRISGNAHVFRLDINAFDHYIRSKNRER